MDILSTTTQLEVNCFALHLIHFLNCKFTTVTKLAEFEGTLSHKITLIKRLPSWNDLDQMLTFFLQVMKFGIQKDIKLCWLPVDILIIFLQIWWHLICNNDVAKTLPLKTTTARIFNFIIESILFKIQTITLFIIFFLNTVSIKTKNRLNNPDHHAK